MVSKQHSASVIAISAVTLFAAILLAVVIGSRSVSFSRAFQGLPPDREILLNLRLPRALLAAWTGGALALSGVVFQALLRESLAEPYTLGVSGGASLGAVVAICFGWGAIGSVSGICFAAFLGSALTLLLVLGVAFHRGRMSSFGLLLAGITINSICSAIILFLSNLATFMQSFAVTRWMIGGLDAPAYSTLFWLSVALAPVCAVIFRYAPEWNVIALGETWAATRGLSSSRLLLIGCLAGSVLTGSVTALTGPIGFVGLIVPHALRLWLGADHRILAPCSFLLGGAFVAVCDVFSRTILAPVDVPVGVMTALLGGPFFIWILRSRQRSRFV